MRDFLSISTGLPSRSVRSSGFDSSRAICSRGQASRTPRRRTRLVLRGFPENQTTLCRLTAHGNATVFRRPKLGQQFQRTISLVRNFAGQFARVMILQQRIVQHGGSPCQRPWLPQTRPQPAMNNGSLITARLAMASTHGQFNNGLQQQRFQQPTVPATTVRLRATIELGMSSTLGPGMPGYNQHRDSRLGRHFEPFLIRIPARDSQTFDGRTRSESTPALSTAVRITLRDRGPTEF